MIAANLALSAKAQEKTRVNPKFQTVAMVFILIVQFVREPVEYGSNARQSRGFVVNVFRVRQNAAKGFPSTARLTVRDCSPYAGRSTAP